MDRDIPMLDDKLIVPSGKMNNDLGIDFASDKIPIKQDCDLMQWEAKKPYHDARQDNLYQPSHSPQNQTFKKYGVSFEKGLKDAKTRHKVPHFAQSKAKNKRPKSKHGMQLRNKGPRKGTLLKGLIAVGITMAQFTTGLMDIT